MLDKLKGGLIVSCQALQDEPLHSSFIMGRMALAAAQGGAVGIRAQSSEDIAEINKTIDLPIIGIVKRKYIDSEVYITPTKKEIDELLSVKCEIIALDATQRQRPNNTVLKDLVTYIHQNNRLAMADCSTYDECIEAEILGFDIISTTLCGYTSYSEIINGPNYSLLEKLVKTLHKPIIAEGKINTPSQLKQVFDIGVHSAVVGTAITRPKQITESFVSVLK